MTLFLLVRHGACAPVGQTIAGWTPGVHLDAVGRAQAARLGEALAAVPLSAVYASPLERAQETAEVIAEPHTLTVETAEEIGELRFGEWTGRAIQELDRAGEGEVRWRHFNTLRSLTRAPAGELMLEVQARAVGALVAIRERHPDGTCVLVSHADVIRAVLAHVAGIPLDLASRIDIAPASASVVRIEPSWVQVLCVNRVFDDRLF